VIENVEMEESGPKEVEKVTIHHGETEKKGIFKKPRYGMKFPGYVINHSQHF